MLESETYGSYIPNSQPNSLREPWFKLFRAFFSYIKNVSRRLFGMGKDGISRRMDAKLQTDVSNIDSMKDLRTKEEQYKEAVFEWVKTERIGEICRFLSFDVDANGVEYTLFDDGTRIISNLIGDIVLMHSSTEYEMSKSVDIKSDDEILGYTSEFKHRLENTQTFINAQPAQAIQHVQNNDNPVLGLIEKSKKRVEKLNVTLNVKILTPELYNVMKQNFDDVDDIILQNVIDQVVQSYCL